VTPKPEEPLDTEITSQFRKIVDTDLITVTTPETELAEWPDFIEAEAAQEAEIDDGLTEDADYEQDSGEPFLVDTIMDIAEEGERNRHRRRTH